MPTEGHATIEQPVPPTTWRNAARELLTTDADGVHAHLIAAALVFEHRSSPNAAEFESTYTHLQEMREYCPNDNDWQTELDALENERMPMPMPMPMPIGNAFHLPR